MRAPTHFRPRPGYTLFEILVVVAVIAIIAALAVPSIEGMYGHVRMTASIDQVKGQWAEARAHAIDNGVPYRFAVMMGQNRFRVAPDLAEFWSGGDSSGGQLEEGTAYIHEEELQKGVLFTNASGGSSGDWQTVAVFMPNGECKEDAELTVGGQGYRSHLLKIRGLTGVVSVQPLDAAGNR
jgi:prepilin-type N-terminal cleavage/methylation domain-containing protein